MRFELEVNRRTEVVETEPDRPLRDVLREDLDLTGAKYGGGEGACRACTVLVDGRPTAACRLPVSGVAGRSILTIEGLATGRELHPVQRAFAEVGAMQCGYCVPGMVLSTVALLERELPGSREDIVRALDGNLCRCCGYPRILEAVELAVERRREARG